MHKLFFVLALLGVATLKAQTEVEGKWVDNDLNFRVEWQNLQKLGEMDICIVKVSEDHCVENVFTSFEVLIYDASGKVVNKSIWSGLKTRLKFRSPVPNAYRLEIRAIKPFVINALTKNKIYQDKPMVLQYKLP